MRWVPATLARPRTYLRSKTYGQNQKTKTKQKHQEHAKCPKQKQNVKTRSKKEIKLTSGSFCSVRDLGVVAAHAMATGTVNGASTVIGNVNGTGTGTMNGTGTVPLTTVLREHAQ